MSLPDDISDSLRIRLNAFTQSGLKPDDPVVVKHITDYIVALLTNDEVRREADDYKAGLDKNA